jgi:hypothetical protein
VGPVVVGDGQRAHEEGLERRRHAQVLLGGQGRRLSQQGDRGASVREPQTRTEDGRGGLLVEPLRASWVCLVPAPSLLASPSLPGVLTWNSSSRCLPHTVWQPRAVLKQPSTLHLRAPPCCEAIHTESEPHAIASARRGGTSRKRGIHYSHIYNERGVKATYSLAEAVDGAGADAAEGGEAARPPPVLDARAHGAAR